MKSLTTVTTSSTVRDSSIAPSCMNSTKETTSKLRSLPLRTHGYGRFSFKAWDRSDRYLSRGAGIAQWLKRRTRDRKVIVRVPAGAAGEFSSPLSTFYADSYFGTRSTPVLPQ